jgi:hypothetical protein
VEIVILRLQSSAADAEPDYATKRQESTNLSCPIFQIKTSINLKFFWPTEDKGHILNYILTINCSYHVFVNLETLLWVNIHCFEDNPFCLTDIRGFNFLGESIEPSGFMHIFGGTPVKRKNITAPTA